MTSALSIEPVSQGLASLRLGNDASAATSQDGDAGLALAARLQRLWQERGDFSKLSRRALLEEVKRETSARDPEEQDEEEHIAGDVDDESKLRVNGATAHGADAHENKEKSLEMGDAVVAAAAAEHSMTPEQLWELKSSMLQGLGLARNDITSALDLLQLLLNPINALNPAVPEEALALPSGSLASTALPTPTPAPSEASHLQTTALTLATKVRAVSKASTLLSDASKRLKNTTEVSQSEWTDLLRIKRAGEWSLEARAAPSASSSSAGMSMDDHHHLHLERMAKEACVFCGIEEARPEWRTAGLARLNDRKGKGRMREAPESVRTTTTTANDDEAFIVPELVEGRRRMVFKVRLPSHGDKEIVYKPAALLASVDHDAGNRPEASAMSSPPASATDATLQLVEAQRELFEEELYAELVREAREASSSAYTVTSTRDSIRLDLTSGVSICVQMQPLESSGDEAIAPKSKGDAEGDGAMHAGWRLDSAACLLSALCRLNMIAIYKTRRADLRQASVAVSRTGDKAVKDRRRPSLIPSLVAVANYQAFVVSLYRTLDSTRRALQCTGVFDARHEADDEHHHNRPHRVSLDFDPLTLSPETIMSKLDKAAHELNWGGLALLTLGSQRHLDISFRSPAQVSLHLPGRTIQASNVVEFTRTLQSAVHAALLGEAAAIVQETLSSSGWQVLPLPAASIKHDTRLLARLVRDGTVISYLAISAEVNVDGSSNSNSCTAQVIAKLAKRKGDVVLRQVFGREAATITQGEGKDANIVKLADWLKRHACNDIQQ